MNIEEAIHRATVHGNSTGQIALGEFILKNYGSELSPKLTSFIERVLQNEYENIGTDMGKPAEDVALEVSKIMEDRLN